MAHKPDLSDIHEVLSYVSGGPFASDKVTRLSGGICNFAFRLHLLQPYEGRRTLVLKHAKPYPACSVDFPYSVDRQVCVVVASTSSSSFDRILCRILKSLP
jgi:hypothetical protein